MKIAVIGGAGVRTVIFINGLLKRYKKHVQDFETMAELATILKDRRKDLRYPGRKTENH